MRIFRIFASNILMPNGTALAKPGLQPSLGAGLQKPGGKIASSPHNSPAANGLRRLVKMACQAESPDGNPEQRRDSEGGGPP